MTDNMLAILGLLTILGTVFLLFKDITVASLSFVAVSCVSAAILLLTGTFTISEIGDFIAAGVDDTSPTAALFMFSVIFFGILTDAGMFDAVINKMTKKVGNSVVGVCIMTCLIATIAHLDGGGASTFLITVPAMLPIYKKLHIRPTTLLLICVTAMGVMNLVPWGGPTIRVATVLGIDANDLWVTLIPMQIVGMILALGTAIFWGKVEVKRGAGMDGKLAQEALAAGISETEDGETTKEADKNDLARPKLVGFNACLTLAVIASLVFVDVPSYLIFMVGCTIALIVNYPGSKQQSKAIARHSSSALMMASTLLTAGVFLGLLNETGMMDQMALMIAGFMPASVAPYLHLIMGLLSAPIAMIFSTDSFFYGLLPVLIGVGEQFNVDPMQISITMLVAKNCVTLISPLVPSVYLGCGLAGVELKDLIKASFFWLWGVSIVCVLSGFLLGILTL